MEEFYEISKTNDGCIYFLCIPVPIWLCDNPPPDEVDVYVKDCQGDSGGVQCDEAGIRFRWHLRQSGGDERPGYRPHIRSSGLDSALVAIDFSGSTGGVNLQTTSGTAIVILTLEDSSVVASAFSWSAFNNVIAIDNPAALLVPA